jgi:hypothetical protein
VNDVNDVFPNRDPFAIADIKSATRVLPDLASVIWLYAREPICMITISVGGVDMISLPAYSFPFSGFPKIPIPVVTLTFHQFRFKFDPPMEHFSISRRNIVLRGGPMEEFATEMMYIPGYDAIAVSGMWIRAAPWRRTNQKTSSSNSRMWQLMSGYLVDHLTA